MPPTSIKERIEQIKNEPSGVTMDLVVGPKIQALILKMVDLPEWDDFIKEFIAASNNDNLKTAQRNRLKLKDNTTNPYIVQSVAYLFANGVCTGTSRGGLLNHIDGILDNGIDLNQP